MSRAARLIDLIQIFRRHRHPVSGAVLANELGISIRTLYRDIDTLKSQGAHIDGEPGIGYVLRPGFMLPPMMFSENEIEALVLGASWVAKRADSDLSAAARNALTKIGAVLPDDLRESMEDTGLMIGPGDAVMSGTVDLAAIRQTIRAGHKLRITYVDAANSETKRIIWPFMLAFFDRIRIVVAWCETKDDFRHFRVDRIKTLTPLNKRYPARRNALVRQWREKEGIDAK